MTLPDVATANLKPSIGSIPVLFEVKRYQCLLLISVVPDGSILRKRGFESNCEKFKTLPFTGYMFN